MLDSAIRALMRPFDRALCTAPPTVPAPTLNLRYLGTAGFVVTHRDTGHTVVLDPYVTRTSALGTVSGPLVPDLAAIERYIPRADDVLIGHAHHDHVLDAPDLCRRTGARLIGSSSAVMVGRAAGLPESQLVETAGDEDIATGPFIARGLPSRHGRVYFGRIPLAGDITAPPPWPARMHHLRHGLVLNWQLRATGTPSIVHIDSADFIDSALVDQPCDVLCLCAIGRHGRPGYTEAALRLLKPKYVIPCHWDLFFGPLDLPAVELPGCDLAGFIDEIRAGGATPLVLDLNSDVDL